MLSSLDVGQNIVFSGVDIPVVSTIDKAEVLALPIVSGNVLFDSEDKWKHVQVKYRYGIDDQGIVLTHRKSGNDWVADGVFSTASAVGTWEKSWIRITDEMNAQLLIGRDIYGSAEDLIVS